MAYGIGPGMELFQVSSVLKSRKAMYELKALADVKNTEDGANPRRSGQPEGSEPQRPSLIQALLQEIIQVVLPALLLALTVHLFLAQATVVFGQSMEPNLSARQRLIIDKISYRFRPPQRDDIIVLKMPSMDELL